MAPIADVNLAACGVAPTLLAALFKAGFRYKADLAGLSARELANEARIDVRDAVVALESAKLAPANGTASSRQSSSRGQSSGVGVTALDVLQQGGMKRPIPTRIQGLDDMLGGGIPCSELTEICGGPGTGKTQLGIHLCLAAQYALDAGSNRSTAIYIDTEGSFLVERVASMATSFSRDFPMVGSRKLDRDDLLQGITYFRVHDFLEQMEVLHSLPALLQAQPECTLVVLDTVAFHFRHGFEDYSQRTRSLDTLATFLHKISADFNIGVVLMNHLTTKSSPSRSIVESPALGESWAHAITTRVILAWEAKCRVARIIKSSTQAHRAAQFEISEKGVRDAEDGVY
ncbi:hypothetical protein Gpo141_00005537 [Globisporangium polare]